MTTASNSRVLRTIPITMVLASVLLSHFALLAPVSTAQPSSSPLEVTGWPLYEPIARIVVPTGDDFATRAVEEKDGYVYLLTRGGILYTYDISDLPLKQSFVTYNTPVYTQTVSHGKGLLRYGNYIYAFGSAGLGTLDVQDPSLPVLLGSRNDVAIDNMIRYHNYLIATGRRRITVYSIEEPSNPVFLSDLNLGQGQWVWSAAVYGSTLYAYHWIGGPQEGYTNTLSVIDFSDPAGLSVLNTISRDDDAYHLRIVGDQLIESGTSHVGLWDLTAPADPVFLTSQPARGRVCAQDGDNVITNGTVFRPEGNELQTISTFNPGGGQADGFPYGSAVNSSFVFIAQSSGILILNASEPAQTHPHVFYVDAVNGDDNNDGLTLHAAFATIQKGIDAAAGGELVLVYPGLYLEEINFLGKTLTVQGVAAGPAGVPVLQNPGDFAVSFYNGEGPDSILKNFIIRDSFMGIFIVDSSPTISNLTIAGNKYGIEAYADSEPDISNTILWNNTDDDLFGCRARYSCVERGGEGDITDDPMFVDPDNGDYHVRSERGRYWPEHDIWVLDKVTSPCVDGGDPDTDTLNEPMPNGGRINIGVYGGTTEASLSPGEQPNPLSGKASNPYPPDGAIDVEGYISLTWTAGLNAVSHDVYFGSNRDVVANADTSDTFGTYLGRQVATSYTLPEDVGGLTIDLYWRIDEVDSQGNTTTGDVWTFRTTSGPPPKGRTCFTSETNVWVNGTLVPISKVGPGQSICGMNSLSKIQEVQQHNGTFACYDVLLESGNCISVAENHYFMTESGQWIPLKNLKTGTRLQTSKGSIGIISVTKRPMPYLGKVYNLKVDGSDRYMVGQDAIVVRDY
jgi:hypothetical protein